MKTYYLLRNRLKLLILPAIILSLGACSSYQYSGYETDGIYGESRPGIWEQAENEQTQVKPNNENNYYKNMFAQQSEMVGELLESDVFTDVDSYSSNDGYDNYSEVGGDVAYVGGNAPWGNDPDTYTVNIINHGPGYGFGFGRPLGWGFGVVNPYLTFYDPFYDPFFNPYVQRGFGRWAFGGPWGYGGFGNSWGYGGFGYGWSYGYNFGFGNPWFNNGFYNRYGYNDPYSNVAYNRGRRNTNDYRSSNNRRSGYSESIRSIRNAQADAARSRSRARGTSDGYDRNNVYSRTSRRTERSGYYDTSNTRTSSPVYRSTRSSSSRSTQTTSPSRRSSSNSRSVRSSSSSTRSSGSSSRSSSSGSSRTSRGGRGGQ